MCNGRFLICDLTETAGAIIFFFLPSAFSCKELKGDRLNESSSLNNGRMR